MTRFSRTDRSVVAEWWWTVDRWMLGATLVLMGLGILLCMAASPPVAKTEKIMKEVALVGPRMVWRDPEKNGATIAATAEQAIPATMGRFAMEA